jgi:hypothetical protein
MAIYKTISSKVIIRKIMRDINPNGDNWIDDAIEWIGEALEHIGSASQLELKQCVITVKNHKAALPIDLYYINQVALNYTEEGVIIQNQIDTLLDRLDHIINGGANYNYTVNEINSRLHVLESQFMQDHNLSVLTKCATTFPKTDDCPDCVNDNGLRIQCYYTEADKIKTSFSDGRICLSYMAFPIDDECYPMVPDDISFKEAMFWYVYKKMLLGNMNPSVNGIGYEYADMQWKFYCTQARNNANYPDIDQYESFMDQWVRLIPNINRHSEGFAGLNVRESLSRDEHKYLVDSMPINSKVPTKAVESGLTKRGSLVNWGINSTDSQNITAGNNTAIQLNNPLTGDYSQIDGSVAITYALDFWLVTGMSSQNTIQYSYTITPSQVTTAGELIIEVVAYNLNTSQDVILESTTYNLNTDQTEPLSGVAENIVGSMSNARIFIRVISPTEGGAAAVLLLSSGDLRIV